MKDGGKQVKPIQVEDYDIKSVTEHSFRASEDAVDSLDSDFYVPTNLKGILNRLQMVGQEEVDNERASSDREAIGRYTDQLQLKPEEFLNFYRYYSVDKQLPWMSYRDYMGHLEGCKACSKCMTWCTKCNEYVVNQRWDKHHKKDLKRQRKLEQRLALENQDQELGPGEEGIRAVPGLFARRSSLRRRINPNRLSE